MIVGVNSKNGKDQKGASLGGGLSLNFLAPKSPESKIDNLGLQHRW